MFRLSVTDTPTGEQIEKAAVPLKKAATRSLMTIPPLRRLILDLRQRFEQIVDEVSKDVLIPEQTGYSPEARQKAEDLVKSFESYLAEHKNEIDALQFFYSVPHKNRLRFKDIQTLANAISAPPRSWTTEKLWRAYETLEKSKVRGASAQRLLTDIVSLVRFALHQDGELVPHADRVRERFQLWLAQQANKGRKFSDEQIQWLDMMRDHIATSLEIDMDSFDLTPFTNEGGLARASRVFGKELKIIVQELNQALAA
jgi:type I restriction enzyme R subunit